MLKFKIQNKDIRREGWQVIKDLELLLGWGESSFKQCLLQIIIKITPIRGQFEITCCRYGGIMVWMWKL